MNKEEAIALVSKNGVDLNTLSDVFRNDKDVVMAAVQENITSFVSASDELHDDKDVVMSILRHQLSIDTWDGKNVLPMYHKLPLRIPFEWISDRLKGDKEVMMQAVRINGEYLRYSSIRNDTDLIVEAIKTYGCALEFASDVVKNDKSIVLVAVQQDGGALLYASPELKRDRDVVLTAIYDPQRAHCIVYADPIFKDDLDMIMMVLGRIDSFSMMGIYNFASARCKMDIGVIEIMYSKHGSLFLNKIPAEAWTNPKILDWAARIPEIDLPARFRGKVTTYKDTISQQSRASNRLSALPNSLVGKISSYLGGKSRKRKNKRNKTNRNRK